MLQRLWAAAEAQALGWGGVAAVTQATGIRDKRRRVGIRELVELRRQPLVHPPQRQRVRRPGVNPHFHSIVLDGVFVPNEDGTPAFHRLPSLSNSDVAEVLQTVRTRVLAFLERRGVIESWNEPTLLDDGCAEQEPALAALASAAVGGAAPAGPERRERPAIALCDASGMRIASALSVAEGGFSLHAATTAAADDAAGREALCRYVLRPPLAQQRLHLLDDGLVRIELKRPFSDGMTCS